MGSILQLPISPPSSQAWIHKTSSKEVHEKSVKLLPVQREDSVPLPRTSMHSDLINWIEALAYPARTHPTDFPHMQKSSPKQDTTTIDLEKLPKKEAKVEMVEESEKEEFHSGSETKSDDDPPPIKRKIQTRAAGKLTLVKLVSKTPAGPESSSKKQRKGK